MSEYVYFLNASQLHEFQIIIKALELAGFEKTAALLMKTYNELKANKIDINLLG